LTQGDYKGADLTTLGRAVTLMREQRHMTADQLADASGVLREHIKALEVGRLDPTYDLLLKVTDGLGAQPSALIIFAEKLATPTDT
jgi:transcriptional regulator with XRE-family HTH domain